MSKQREYKDDPVEVTKDVYWVGFYDKEASLHCNPYLIVDGDEAVLIDPGSIPDFPVVMRKIIDIINPEKISSIIAQHQDPDVCGNLPVVEDVIDRYDLSIYAHSSTTWLIRHLGLSSKLVPVDKQDYRLTLKSGRTLEFIFTPYLHSPGAITTYDSRTRSLFSSDIFGAMSKEATLAQDDDFPESMCSWHQAIMPSGSLLKAGLERFESLEIDRILPQHGSMIGGDRVNMAFEYLKNLPCGYDLISER